MNIQPMIDVGIRLQEIIKREEYDSLLQVLNKIIIPNGCMLKVKLYELEEDRLTMSADSTIELTFPDGTCITGGSESNIRDYITAENSPMGAWQLYLLYNLHSYLPMYWHALYGLRKYIYTREQLEGLHIESSVLGTTKEPFCVDDYDVTPVIEQSGNRYNVAACFWNSFGGLYAHVRIQFLKDGSMRLKELSCDNWYYYRLNMRF